MLGFGMGDVEHRTGFVYTLLSSFPRRLLAIPVVVML